MKALALALLLAAPALAGPEWRMSLATSTDAQGVQFVTATYALADPVQDEIEFQATARDSLSAQLAALQRAKAWLRQAMAAVDAVALEHIGGALP